MNTENKTKLQHLMMASIDGESTVEQEAELREALLNNKDSAVEYHHLKNMKLMTMQSRLKPPPPELWDHYTHQTFTRVERGFAWILITLGAIVLISYTIWMALSEFFGDPSIAWWIKGSTGAVILGVILLMISFIRERLFLHKHERYKDIIR